MTAFVVALALAAVGGCGTAPANQQPAPAAGTALELLANLAVQGRGPMTGYDRKLFVWNGYDFDRNGCDQRNDILKRDLDNPVIKPGSNGCRVESGTLRDPYTSQSQQLTRSQIEIDHVVSLANSWQTGAAQWGEQQRKNFANDPLNLTATTIKINRQKGDRDASGWLPPTNRCGYVARQIAVKTKYQLAVVQAEKDTMAKILKTCPTQKPTAAQQRL